MLKATKGNLTILSLILKKKKLRSSMNSNQMTRMMKKKITYNNKKSKNHLPEYKSLRLHLILMWRHHYLLLWIQMGIHHKNQILYVKKLLYKVLMRIQTPNRSFHLKIIKLWWMRRRILISFIMRKRRAIMIRAEKIQIMNKLNRMRRRKLNLYLKRKNQYNKIMGKW